MQTTHNSNIIGQAERDLGDCQNIYMEVVCKSSFMQDRDVFIDADCSLMALIILCIGIMTIRRSISSIRSQRQHASIALAGCNVSGQLHQPLQAYKNC